MESYRAGFIISQILGHALHGERIRSVLADHPEIHPHWMPIFPWARDFWHRVPILGGNLTLVSGLQARRQLRACAAPLDVLYCHTQEVGVLLASYMKRIPTILSMDATPANMDTFGKAYGHEVGPQALEHFKHRIVRRSFHLAAHIVTFSDWARQSLMSDYQVPGEKITVNMPGVDLSRWSVNRPEAAAATEPRPARLLFVGGDFWRKGGDVLLRCAAEARGEWELDIVTRDPVDAAGIPNVRVHREIKAGTEEHEALYRRADVFVLPTRGDCSPWAISEAMAMRLPVIATTVGAIPELVVHGDTGLLVPPGSTGALLDAIQTLTRDPGRRRTMGCAGRDRVERHFDGRRTYGELLACIKNVADAAGGRAPHHTMHRRRIRGT
jgi:glycosyltransferase involved in cell wall biosynthesis